MNKEGYTLSRFLIWIKNGLQNIISMEDVLCPKFKAAKNELPALLVQISVKLK